MLSKINYTVLAVFAAGLLATSGDITMTWTSPTYSKLYSNDTSINPIGRPITSSEDGWIGSLINIGAMIGPLPYSYIAERFGRRIGLLSISIPHMTAYLIFAFANKVYLFYLGRLLGGLAVGGGYTLLPMYIAEVSDDSNRGLLSSCLMPFWAFGNFLPYALGPFISIKVFNLILACFPVSFFIIFLLFGVETPYYFLKTNQSSKAEDSLMTLRSLDKKEIQEEMTHMKENLRREENGHFSDIIKNRGPRKALFISLLLISFQQLSGTNGLFFYLQPIFDAAGTHISSDICSVVSGCVLFASSAIVPILINKFGRKTLTMSSCGGVSLSLISLGTYFYIQDSTSIDLKPIFWLPIFSFMSYIVTFSSGMSVLPWTISSELFPTNVKQISASAVSMTCWMVSFLVTNFFNNMVDAMGRAGLFYFFAGNTVAAIVFTYFCVPETKGKSFREIQDILER